ncbi:MAG: hypothetical protein A3G18_05105 [Rhodospirillales bacterium RIFCSPLOWO2_12_FULL_58_28]|nr:MAG: hypothetical protein A3H92_05200 [Rhodospirillales bacterium RIFCSPLOWO2_02_FULL_58_16]OHC78288.1 MAG: hypothetical protein A3G18_05105 [Rhodospirillales bacterium RIFCSPLOWO2_12_FULL_58_28]
MKYLSVSRDVGAVHPLDVVEKIVDENDWTSDRQGNREIVVQAPGRWCNYSLYFTWNEDLGAVHFTCAFDLRAPAERRAAMHELLALINEKVCLGHFGLWDEEGLPMYRHALLLRGAGGPSREQMEDMVDAAIMESDRFYPAFQHVIWGGRTAHESVSAAMVDTIGEA